jgi:hypothetical protein
LRLESFAYIGVGAFAFLTLAFLVVLAPLVWTAALHFTFGRFAIARREAVQKKRGEIFQFRIMPHFVL